MTIFLTNARSIHFTLLNFLGELFASYSLISYNYIPERMIEKFNKLSATLVESGLYLFLKTIQHYQEKIKHIKWVAKQIHVFGVCINLRRQHQKMK